MNEKIRQLMLESTNNMPETYYWPGEYVEKFAELIIKECAHVADDAHDGIGKYVIGHFGVEE